MPAMHVTAKVEWEDGDVPVSQDFGDSYYARSDGLAETRHVFLEANALPERFDEAEGFHIAELGFGTGLNFCATLDLWGRTAPPGAHMTFTSFEAAPMDLADMVRALDRWPEISVATRALADAWRHDPVLAAHASPPGARPAAGDMDVLGVTLKLVLGDARHTLPQWDGSADAWFLDGFAPARNPEMWGEDLLRHVFDRTVSGGTFATYSAAGHVRRGLQAAGFEVHRRPGFGTKREMLAGRRS